MGFDPRQWTSVSQPSQRQRVTSNVQSLLVENDALRHEVRRLRAEVDRLRLLQVRENHHRSKQSSNDATEVSRITAFQIDAWGQVLSQQVGWGNLRLRSLITLIERLNRKSFHPKLNLYQRLDRLMPGFGSELHAAMAGSLTKKRGAVWLPLPFMVFELLNGSMRIHSALSKSFSSIKSPLNRAVGPGVINVLQIEKDPDHRMCVRMPIRL